ncbi:hypothetical protein SAMN05216360_11069 [Methylobacterium phyllostachyos]|uniref:Anti-sigma factor NepR domain-containing protein n=1 Tax=Methylobacterium phyllostachyos TaxID=582672 RepID=A0A1H0D8S2_9HYPH|nr:hypothetical protein [Methylobacterium phyllostachyos]SDN66604.1 hypothetical protein SAMN05216360_11069 [Methylobacterium phyllostachyos]
MPQSHYQRAASEPASKTADRTGPGGTPAALHVVPIGGHPALDAQTRSRLGQQLRALYDPVIDEALDPRLAELLQQLDADRAGGASR